MSDLPQYQCHKKVRAGRIDRIDSDVSTASEPALYLHGMWKHVYVTWEWMDKHQPQEGGCYVEYEDGYTSYSPAEAFEEGYSLIESAEEKPNGEINILGGDAVSIHDPDVKPTPKQTLGKKISEAIEEFEVETGAVVTGLHASLDRQIVLEVA